MDKILSDLPVAVLGSFIATVIFLLIPEVRRVLVDSLTRNSDVSGKWDWFEDASSEKTIGSLEIKQRGGIINGRLTRNISRSGKKIDRHFRVYGNIYGDNISLFFFEVDDKRRRGVISLVLGQVNGVMYGRNCFIEVGNRRPHSNLFLFMRNEKSDITPAEVFSHLSSLEKSGEA